MTRILGIFLALTLVGCEQPCAKGQERVCHGSPWGQVCECVAK